jgi:uncharacterized protein
VSAPLITVRGEASVETDPELAQLTVVVHALGEDRGQILRRIAACDHARSELVDGYGKAIERHEPSMLAVHPWGREFCDGRYVGTSTWTITVVDFTVLGELVTRLTEGDAAELCGPRWMLRPAGEVQRGVRQAAVHDAVCRAREYATALGCELTGLVELTDSGLTTTPASRNTGFDGDVLGEEETLQAGAALPVTCTLPERQLVRARVLARFTSTAPGCL